MRKKNNKLRKTVKCMKVETVEGRKEEKKN